MKKYFLIGMVLSSIGFSGSLHEAQEAIMGKKLPQNPADKSATREERIKKDVDETLRRLKEEQKFDRAWWDNRIKIEIQTGLSKSLKEDERSRKLGKVVYPKDRAKRERFLRVLHSKFAYCDAYEMQVSRYGHLRLEDNPQKDEISTHRAELKKLCIQFENEYKILKEELDDEYFMDKAKGK